MFEKDFQPNAKIHWMDDAKAVRVEWLELFMTMERFQTICGEAIAVLKANGGEIWIADQYNSKGSFKKEIQDFIVNELEALALQAGIKKVLTVLPQELGLSSMSTKRWNANVEERGNFMTRQFKTLEECENWVLEQA